MRTPDNRHTKAEEYRAESERLRNSGVFNLAAEFEALADWATDVSEDDWTDDVTAPIFLADDSPSNQT